MAEAVGCIVDGTTELDPALDPSFVDVVVDLAGVAVMVVSPAGVILGANETAETLFGASPGRLVGSLVEDLLPSAMGRRHRVLRESFADDRRHRVVAAGRVLPARGLDGRALHVRVGLHPTSDGRTVCVVVDHTREELARAEAEVSASRAAELVATLDSLKIARERLLTAASHELRTPLTVVLGGARTLQARGDDLLPAVRQELLDRVVASASRLNLLLDDLALAGAAARVEVDFTRLDLVGMLRRAVHEVRSERQADVRLVTQLREAPVRINPLTVERAVGLLVDNGLRYGAPPVEVHVRAEGERVLVDVVDAGGGIPPRLLDAALQPLGRAAAFDEVQPGLGIGLPLARVLVQANGGEFRPGCRGDGIFLTLDFPRDVDGAGHGHEADPAQELWEANAQATPGPLAE